LAADRELNNPKVTRAWYSLGQLLEQTGYDLAAAEAYARFDVALWQTHGEQRNAPEFVALLARHPYGMVPRRLWLLKRLERHDDALRAAEWARDIWPDDWSVDRLYARALISAGRSEHAFTFCRERLGDRQAAEALLPIAVEAARAADRLPRWVDEVVAEIARGTGIEQARRLTGMLQDAGESAQAVRVGQALLVRQPADDEIAWEVAAAQHADDDLRGALETLVAFVRSSPDLAELPPPRLAEWISWFESGTKLADLVKELRARPDADFATDFVLGVSALAADEPALAEELLRSCVASRPDFAPAYLARGEMLLASYQWDAARQYAEELLEEHPELVAAHYLLARAREGLDENEPAEGAYKQAIKLRPEQPTYSLALAQHYRRLGNLRGAQRYFQQVLADAPDNGEALEGLIDCYLRGGKIEIARAQLDGLDREAVPADSLRRIDTLMRFVSDPFGEEHLAELQLQSERYPNDVATARLLAGGLHYRDRLDEAREVIERVRGRHPDDYHLTVLLANVHARQGELDQAISLLSALARRFPNRLMVLEPLAEYCLNDFRFEEGRPALQRVIELEEDDARRAAHQEKLRDSFLIFGEYDQTLRMVERWIENEPDNEWLLLHKAIILIYAERMEEAFAALEEWLKLNPTDPERRERFCRMGSATEQHEQVVARIREWLEGDESNVRVTGWLVDALLAADRADEAFAIAREFEGAYAESFERRIWLGRCHAAKGEIAEALAEFDALLDERFMRDSQRRDVWEQIALTLLSAERFDELLSCCAEWLEQSENLSPAFRPIALHWKRRALQLAGRDPESAEVMEALLAYVPAIADVLDEPGYNWGLFNDLGYVWVDLGMNLDRAGELIRLAVATEPWNAAYLDSLGWAYYKGGDFSNARKYLARAAQLRDGQDPVVYDHLADAAYRLDDREAAREYWNKAVSLLQTELSEREQARLTDLLAAVRVKLTALERSEIPAVAPTAAEQHKDQDED
ncbi:MAG: tetratricopeptide repeat protein, partial [Planctomycetes bacterium]|nr:tetratricopeptide repeat protein [Planctomycetota bacterium]